MQVHDHIWVLPFRAANSPDARHAPALDNDVHHALVPVQPKLRVVAPLAREQLPDVLEDHAPRTGAVRPQWCESLEPDRLLPFHVKVRHFRGFLHRGVFLQFVHRHLGPLGIDLEDTIDPDLAWGSSELERMGVPEDEVCVCAFAEDTHTVGEAGCECGYGGHRRQSQVWWETWRVS